MTCFNFGVTWCCFLEVPWGSLSFRFFFDKLLDEFFVPNFLPNFFDVFLTKGLIIVGPVLIAPVPFWVPSEIDSWNFQHVLLFWFCEASQNLSLFRQLFFHSFQGGTKGKRLKNCQNYSLVFQHFSFGPPLETMKKKLSK